MGAPSRVFCRAVFLVVVAEPTLPGGKGSEEQTVGARGRLWTFCTATGDRLVFTTSYAQPWQCLLGATRWLSYLVRKRDRFVPAGDRTYKEAAMTIPIDVPGGEHIREWPSGRLQAGTDALPDGQFRGVILIGDADAGLARVHVCARLHDTADAAREEAQAYVDANTPRQGNRRS